MAEEALTSLWGKEPAAAGTMQEHTSVRNMKKRGHGTRSPSPLHRPGVRVGWKFRNRFALWLWSKHLQRDTQGYSPAPHFPPQISTKRHCPLLGKMNTFLPWKIPMGMISTTGLFSGGHRSAPCSGHRWDFRGEGSSDRMQDRLQKWTPWLGSHTSATCKIMLSIPNAQLCQ